MANKEFSSVGFTVRSSNDLVKLYSDNQDKLKRTELDGKTWDILDAGSAEELWFYDKPDRWIWIDTCLPRLKSGQLFEAVAGNVWPDATWPCPIVSLQIKHGQGSISFGMEYLNHLDPLVGVGDLCLADIGLFPRYLTVYNGWKAYADAAETDPIPRLRTFADNCPEVFLTAEIQSAERKVNLLTGLKYWLMTLDYQGLTFTVAVCRKDLGLPSPAAGKIVSGCFLARGVLMASDQAVPNEGGG